ncbi:MAG: mechanosensitive ion channel family protein, partial [Rhodospirillales bacterium]
IEMLHGELKNYIMSWVQVHTPFSYIFVFDAFVVLWVIVFSIFVHIFLHAFLRNFLIKCSNRIDKKWAHVMLPDSLFRRLAYLFQGVVIHFQAGQWLDDSPALQRFIESATELWILLFFLLAFFSMLNFLEHLIKLRFSSINFPHRGLIQTIKLIASIFIGLIVISILLDESPVIILSGFGAVSAVILLVFKDLILGLTAGIQLSANKMLSVGDWLEMPKYGANGNVIEIALTTVKVRNWDKTITTIPTYVLISDSFKNWRGMSEAGGRRIKRSVLIEISTIQFLTEEMLGEMKKVRLITDYVDDKIQVIKNVNQLNSSVPLNGRRLTNIGTFRAYLSAYLKAHPQIRQDMTLFVSQLESRSEGLPIQVYAFTTTTDWIAYEDIQSDIFDHIFSVLPEFGLRAHETPTGSDVRAMSERLKEI